MSVTTVQRFNMEGLMIHQCVIFASKEEVKDLISHYNYPYNPGNNYEVSYEEMVAILVDNGIKVEVVVGFGTDTVNGYSVDMNDVTLDGEPLTATYTLDDLVSEGRSSLVASEEE